MDGLITLPSDAKTGAVDAVLVEKLVSRYQQDGCLILEDVFDRAFIQEVATAFQTRYVNERLRDRASRVGDERWMFGIHVEPPFDDPRLYANPLLLTMIRKLLGPDAVLNSYGAVVSMPGAQMQPPHADHAPLFFDQVIDGSLPSFALTIVIPLIDLTIENGPTALWRGTHKQLFSDMGALNNYPVDVFPAPMGAAYVFDYRLQHAGLSNDSDTPRPIMYIVYSRPWFRDYLNFSKVFPLSVSQEAFDRMHPDHQALFKQALQQKNDV